MITFLGDIALLNNDIRSEYIPEAKYVCNFEYVTGKNKGVPTPNKVNIYSSCCDLKKVFSKFPNAVVIANNHMLDYGKEGLYSTIECLKAQGVNTIGTCSWWSNTKTCVLAYSLINGSLDGVNYFSFDKEKAKFDISTAKEKGASTIIVNMHWGLENFSYPTEKQIEIGHWLIDNGVDLIIGHHPHCIQPIERYKGKWIFYSLGNCIFPMLNVKSHFDRNGIPKRNYRFKWQKWNKKSLAVSFDENNYTIKVDELFYDKNVLRCKCRNLDTSKYLLSSTSKSTELFKYTIRKYYLFFRSNFFVDGKIVDWGAVKQEIFK